MKYIITSILLTLLITNIGRAIDPTKTELNNIYLMYSKGDYRAAEQKLINLSSTADPKLHFTYALELGDLYFDKFNDLVKAESIYKLLTEKYPKHPDIADIYYRLAFTYEREERFLEAAQMDELVATKYRKSLYAQDALDAIERDFKKNYQDLVAKVDGYPITRIEFDDRMAQSPGNYDSFALKKKLLDDMIGERLMYKQALAQGIDTNEGFKSRVDEIRSNIMFQEWYQREIVNKVKVTEGDKESYYSKHNSEFITPEQVSAREILVKTKPEADSLYHLITLYNLPFDSVAQETSAAPTKSNGGDLGFFPHGVQPKEIEDVAFKLKPQAVSPPIYSPTKKGYVILKVEDYKPKVVRKYKDVSAEIDNSIKSQRIDAMFKAKTDAFKQASHVTVDEAAIKNNRDTLATIDDEVITQKNIDNYLSRIPPFYRSEFETPEGKKRILDQIILEKTWLRELEKEKYWLFNAVFSQLQDSKKNLLLDNIRRVDVSDSISVSDSAVQKEYQEHIKDYYVPEQIRTREITVRNESLATQIRNAALNGKISFDSLARNYSIAANKAMGGDMGYFSAGSKPKEIENVAFKLKKGQISKIIKMNDSTYTFLKIEDIKDATTKKLDEVKSTIQHNLRQSLDKELFDNFIANLRNSHQIETYLVNETPNQEAPKIENPPPQMPPPHMPTPENPKQ
jgi:peptidyl-prolyl cis-trans isomerase C